jgi:hypothetical protein
LTNCDILTSMRREAKIQTALKIKENAKQQVQRGEPLEIISVNIPRRTTKPSNLKPQKRENLLETL